MATIIPKVLKNLKLKVVTVAVVIGFMAPAAPAVHAMSSATPSSGGLRAADANDSSNFLHIGGEFRFNADSYGGRMPVTGTGDAAGGATGDARSKVGVSQRLTLSLDGSPDEHWDFLVRLNLQGVWGVQFPSDGSYGFMPTSGPLIVDEAYIRYIDDRILITGGRFRFVLGPVGLLGNNVLVPLEGLMANSSLKGVYLTGVYSRLSSQYQEGTFRVIGSDDLQAFRVAKPIGDWILGGNYLRSGLLDETGYSLDFKGLVGGREVIGEVAYFRPSTTYSPEFNFGWVPGYVVGMDLVNTQNHRLNLRYGEFSKGFTPTFSSLAFSSAGEALKFDHNTKGLHITYNRALASDAELELAYVGLRFVDPAEASRKGLDKTTPLTVVSASLTKAFSEKTLGELEFDRWANDYMDYYRLRLGFTLYF